MELPNVVLQNVEADRRDLSAVRVIQEEKGHYELEMKEITYEYDGHHGNSYPKPSKVTEEVPTGRKIWVVDVPKKTEPDYEKQKHARDRLQEIYTTSNWYSARYAAGSALQISQETLQNDLDLWISRLEDELKATKREERLVNQMKSSFTFVDQDVRLKAIKDTAKLFQISRVESVRDTLLSIYSGDKDELLAGAYEDVNEDGEPVKCGYIAELRRVAGKELGYSSLKIWLRNLVS